MGEQKVKFEVTGTVYFEDGANEDERTDNFDEAVDNVRDEIESALDAADVGGFSIKSVPVT